MTVELLYRAHANRLLARTLSRGTRRVDAEDACARAWLILLRKWPDLSFATPTDALKWLTVVARNELYAIRRERRREDVARPAAGPDGEPRDPDEHIAELAGSYTDDAAHELRHVLDRLGRLPVYHCRVGPMTALLGLSYDQAQEALGRSHTWVNRARVEGRAALREQVTA